MLYWDCHVDVVGSGSVGSLTQPPSHVTALFITPPSCTGSPPSMHLEAPAHSPKPIAPTQSNGRKLLPLPSPLHSPPGRHLSSCSCSCSAQLLLLFTQRRLAARARRTLWIITHTWACLDAHTHARTCTDTSWFFSQDIFFYEGVGIGFDIYIFFDICCACCADKLNLVKG